MIDPGILIALFQKPLDNLYKYIGQEFSKDFKSLLNSYQERQIQSNFYSKTIIHRVNPVNITQFYYPLFIEKDYNYLHKKTSTREHTFSVNNLFSKHPFILITGTAGAGKSTLLKYLYIDCLEKSNYIPIKVELRRLNDFSGNLLDYITNDLFGYRSNRFPKDSIDKLFSSGMFTFFFDGYDELNNEQSSKVYHEIDTFIRSYRANRFLITSRPFTNIELLNSVWNYTISPFQEHEKPLFIKKQLESSPTSEIAEKIILALNNSDNKTSPILNNPLMLSLYILNFHSYSELPQKKSDFYGQIFETLFMRHDSEAKLGYVREKISGLSKEQFEILLRVFSFSSYFDETYIFSQEYIYEIFNLVKSEYPSFHDINIDKVIYDLKISLSILYQDGTYYSFPHRSFQEYFAAAYIKTSSTEIKIKIYEILVKKIIHHSNGIGNFMEFLSEMDSENFLKLFTLPINNNIYKKLFTSHFDFLGKKIKLKQMEDVEKRKYILSASSIGKEWHAILTSNINFINYTLNSVNKNFNISNLNQFTNIQSLSIEEIEEVSNIYNAVKEEFKSLIKLIEIRIDTFHQNEIKMIDLIFKKKKHF